MFFTQLARKTTTAFFIVINFLVKKNFALQNIYTFIIAMKLKQIIRKVFAVVLIIVFSLKAGTGLYFHDYVHIKNSACTAEAGPKEIKLICNCIIDFYLPFTKAAQQQITFSSFTYKEYILSATSSVFTSACFFHLLRAPPASQVLSNC
jgi:hypothetical protein